MIFFVGWIEEVREETSSESEKGATAAPFFSYG